MLHHTSQPSSPLREPYSYRPRRPSINTPPSHKSSKHRPVLFMLFAILALVGCWGLGAQIIRAMRPPVPVFSMQLATQINAIIKQNPTSQISVSLRDISTNASTHYGTSAAFDAASTAKLITACAYYHLVEQGKADLSASMGYYDAQFNLEQMITGSNNDSWHLLTDAIGTDVLQQYARSIGLNYDTTDNTLTSDTMALLLSKIYTGKLLTTDHTKQLLSYMQNTNDEALIPAALPSDITVYHKYGLLDGNLHDASIIVRNGKAYSFVIYTKNSDDSDDDARTTVIHQLTQIVTSQLSFNSDTKQ